MNKHTLYTIGHSTRELDKFLELLHSYGITNLADIRTIPKSRRVPWFNQNALKEALKKEKINYIHLAKLGGLRHAKKESHNLGWHNASFRGFADYMETNEFQEGLTQLNELIQENRKVVIMCAEGVPWRCHRSLIGDAELAQGIEVKHIMDLQHTKLHQMTPFAIVISKNPPLLQYPKSN